MTSAQSRQRQQRSMRQTLRFEFHQFLSQAFNLFRRGDIDRFVVSVATTLRAVSSARLAQTASQRRCCSSWLPAPCSRLRIRPSNLRSSISHLRSRRQQQRTRIGLIVLHRKIVWPNRHHLREDLVHLSCVPLRSRHAQPSLISLPQFRCLCDCAIVGRVGHIDSRVFLRKLADLHKLRRVTACRFTRALPIIFFRRFFAQLRAASRQIHLLHEWFEREWLASE